MAREERLGLVKRFLRLLVGEMRPEDEIGIVIYGDRGGVLLEPTDGGDVEDWRKGPSRIHSPEEELVLTVAGVTLMSPCLGCSIPLRPASH